MSQYRNLASGGFALFLAASQVGCAGGGLKNIFTRNETDGYHSIDELEAEERRLADAEESAEDEGGGERDISAETQEERRRLDHEFQGTTVRQFLFDIIGRLDDLSTHVRGITSSYMRRPR